MKFFKHPKLAVLRDTIAKCAVDLSHFFIVYTIIYTIFVIMSNSLFGQDLKQYHTAEDTYVSLFLIMLGDFDYYQLHEFYPTGALLFFVTYILMMSFVMFNIVLGIVCAAYDHNEELMDASAESIPVSAMHQA